MANPLHNRRALVTGGSSGIGYAIAEKLAVNGIVVTVADVACPPLLAPNIQYRYCDVSKGEDIDNLYNSMLPELPQILILCAGKGIHERLTEGDPEKWADLLNVNVMGILRCIRAFVPYMQDQKQGNVVIISSVAAQKVYDYGGVYAASKAAVNSIAETLRIETMPHVAVTTIMAGMTNTNFLKDRPDIPHLKQTTGSLNAMDIADDVFYAISKPGGSVINVITARPSGQVF